MSYLKPYEQAPSSPAKDATAPHVHAANSVVIFLSHSTFGIQVIGDKPVITTVNPGDIRFVAYGEPNNQYRFYSPNLPVEWSDTGRSILLDIN